jgi:hypothetical protein
MYCTKNKEVKEKLVKEEEERELKLEKDDNFIYITNIYENKFCYIFNNSIFDSKYVL